MGREIPPIIPLHNPHRPFVQSTSITFDSLVSW